MTKSAYTPSESERPEGNEPVDITGKHFDAASGEWVKDDAASLESAKETDESTVAPGDALAQDRATSHNENGTEGR